MCFLYGPLRGYTCNEKPTITNSSFGGVAWLEVETVQSKIVICEMLQQIV
jgi:hypothetical protein